MSLLKSQLDSLRNTLPSCSRLNLTPLAYLWQRNQTELLNEMVEAGMEAILIKVAGIGLTPDHLGKSLAQMQSHLINLVQLFQPFSCPLFEL